MPDEILYYKDATTGDFKEDKRAASKVEYNLAKINITIDNMEKSVEARLTMFESLLRTNLEHACEDMDSTKKANEESNKQLVEKFKLYYNGAINDNKIKFAEIDTRLDEQDIEMTSMKKRVENVENEPNNQKARRYDKIIWSIIGIISTILLTNLKQLIESLL